MRAAIIENGKVVNIIKVPSLEGHIDASGAGIGDGYVGGQFVKPAAPPPVVPKFVTRRQARQALLLANLLDQVEPHIEAIADPTERGLARIWWTDSLDFDRNHPLIVSIGAALGLDAAGLDALFVQAAGL